MAANPRAPRHPPSPEESCRQRVYASAAVVSAAIEAAHYYARRHVFFVIAVTNPILAGVLWIAVLSAYLAAGTALTIWTKNALEDCDKPSPLILDLDGDGVEADALTYFDHEGDGWTELSSWADEDDGTLVWDRNADGVINDGSELFGDNTILASGNKAAHGFAALADLDDNGDGVIDSSDAAWTELQVMRWTDDNNNGMKDDGEEFLVTLDSLGIESLNTGFTNSNHVDSSGNEHRQAGSYTQTDSLADFRIPPLVELRKITLNHGFSREQFGRYRALG